MPRRIEPEVSGGSGPVSGAVLDQASQWLVKLWSGIATHEDQRACERWRAEHAEHERAWQQLQTIEQQLHVVPHDIAGKTLRSAAQGRRRTLKVLGALAIGGTAAYGASRTATWQRYAADHRTGVGESRAFALSDSTRVLLNTASAIDVRYDDRQRLVRLRAGEILVTTAPDSAAVARPFSVATTHGVVRALGTRFTVRQTDDDISRVAVFEGAVTIQPHNGSGRSTRLEAGQQTTFSLTGVETAAATDASASAWEKGLLMVERMRLDVFLRELGRYRPGWLRCDPAVGALLLTGVYGLSDTDRILASVARALPIRLVYQTPYWVTVTSR